MKVKCTFYKNPCFSCDPNVVFSGEKVFIFAASCGPAAEGLLFIIIRQCVSFARLQHHSLPLFFSCFSSQSTQTVVAWVLVSSTHQPATQQGHSWGWINTFDLLILFLFLDLMFVCFFIYSVLLILFLSTNFWYTEMFSAHFAYFGQQVKLLTSLD